MSHLTGIRVLDFTPFLPGHFCTQILGDLGAEVVKVERPGTGNDVRTTRPGIFWTSNRNKKSLTANLKHPEAKRLLLELAAHTDVVVEAFRPGTMDGLGLGYAAMKAANPGIVYCAISGFGQDGPYRDLAGYDINFLAMCGALSLPGTVDQPPSRPAIPIGDLSSGMFAAIGILAALHRRRETGQGEYVDVAMLECLISLTSVRMGEYLMAGLVPEPSELSYLSPASTVFACAGGDRLAVGALEDHFWRHLCKALDRDDWAADARLATNAGRLRHTDELLPVLQAAFAAHPREHWLRVLRECDVPCAPVNDPAEVFADPQVRHRSVAPDAGGGQRQVRLPVRFDGQDCPVAPVPAVGEHTEAILARLGYGPTEIARLMQAGAV